MLLSTFEQKKCRGCADSKVHTEKCEKKKMRKSGEGNIIYDFFSFFRSLKQSCVLLFTLIP